MKETSRYASLLPTLRSLSLASGLSPTPNRRICGFAFGYAQICFANAPQTSDTLGALGDMQKKTKEAIGNRLKHIILYGSYARGCATEDSDIDLFIVLEGKAKPGEEIDRMIEIITEINLRYNVLISVYPISEEDYKKVNSPLLLNV